MPSVKRPNRFCYWVVQSVDGKELQQIPVTDGKRALSRAVALLKKQRGMPPLVSPAVCE